jgi:hypothetical protein
MSDVSVLSLTLITGVNRVTTKRGAHIGQQELERAVRFELTITGFAVQRL